MRLELPPIRLMRRKPADGLQEIKPAPWPEINLEGLAFLAVGVALGVAGVLVTALFAKLLSRDSKG
jgi:hypothetical protein